MNQFLSKTFPIDYWRDLEKNSSNPIYSTGVETMEYTDLKESIKDENKVKKIISETYNGKIFIVKKAFSKKFIETIDRKSVV